MTYKTNMLDNDNSSGFEYGAKHANLKKKVKQIDKSKYLVCSNTKDNDSNLSKRRCFSEENSRNGSISLSTQKVVFNRQRSDSRNSSLENIHTFHLKQSIERSANRLKNSQASLEKDFISSKVHSLSVNSDGEVPSSSIYVEERVKLLKNNQYTHIYKCLKELWKQIKEFKTIYLLTTENQHQYFEDQVEFRKGLNISFEDDIQITNLIKSDKFKINTRSVLGVKNTNDWIYGLNIGNIMHLTPYEFDDLYKDFSDAESDTKDMKELTNDWILEKIIYLSSAYFWIATELRFLNKKQDKTKYPKKQAEMWHAKAVHTCWSFLPKESPLSMHIHNSYIKHHLKPKLEQKEAIRAEKERQRKIEEEEQKQRQALLDTQESMIKMSEQSLYNSNSKNESRSKKVQLSPRQKITGITIESPRNRLYNYARFYQRSNEKNKPLIKSRNDMMYNSNNSKVSNETKLKMYISSVSSMYNEQMKKMQQQSMHSRLYEKLKNNKTNKDNQTKSFSSFSMNNYKSASHLNQYKEDAKATEKFLR